jgi:hypothetical protein
MTPAQEALLNLCSALGIDTRGLADDVLEIIALRIVIEDVLSTKPNIERVIADVKRAEAGKVEPTCCTPIKQPYPSGWWLVHSKFCKKDPKAKIRRLGHPAGENKVSKRLATTHATEDARSTLVPVFRMGSCEKCGAPTTRGLYCKDCRALLDLVKRRRA